MSVYTPVSQTDLESFLSHYALGKLVGYTGISAGIENTNYFVTTEQGEYVLTLFESLQMSELDYFLNLMAFMAEHGVPSAHPLADNNGRYLRGLLGKPAALVQRLEGASVDHPDVSQCAALGTCMAQMHLSGMDYTGRRNNDRGPHWWQVTAKKVMPHLPAEQAALLQQELAYQATFRHSDLPRGVIHADLFRDNALFNGQQLTGVIDFYYACNDVLLYDLAVTVNDWCSLEDGSLETDKARALLGAYNQRRPLQSHEREAWSVMLRAAALRFWLSRLADKLFPRDGELTHIKDPEVFRRILQRRIDQTGREVWI